MVTHEDIQMILSLELWVWCRNLSMPLGQSWNINAQSGMDIRTHLGARDCPPAWSTRPSTSAGIWSRRGWASAIPMATTKWLAGSDTGKRHSGQVLSELVNWGELQRLLLKISNKTVKVCYKAMCYKAGTSFAAQLKVEWRQLYHRYYQRPTFIAPSFKLMWQRHA